jgi:hypothetical protein
VALLAVAAVPVPARSADEPALVVKIKSINGLIEDAKYVANLSGVGNEADQAEGFLKAFMGGKGSEPIDPTRPLGFYGAVSEDFISSGGVVLIPVNSDKNFLEFLERFNIKSTKDAEGIYTVSTEFPIPLPIYLRLENKYAYVTVQNKGSLAKNKLLDPAKVLASGRQTTVAASFHLDRIPESVKQLVLGGMELRVAEEQDKKQPGETDAQQAFRKEVLKNLARQAAELIKEGDRLDLSFDVDRNAKELVAEANLAGKPGTKLAASINELSQAKSLFAGLPGPGTAASALVHAALPADIRQALQPVIDEAVSKILASQQDQTRREQADKFFKAFNPTLKAAELDLGLVVHGPGQDKHYTVVLGMKLTEGMGLDSALRELAKTLPEREAGLIKFNAETAGDVKIHRIDVQVAFNDAARQVLGENPFYVAIMNDRILFSAGPEGLKALKDALSAEAKAGPLFQVEMSVSHFGPLLGQIAAAHGNPDALAYIQKAVQEASADGGKDGDTLHISVEGGKNIKARYVVKAPAVKFLGMMAPRAARAK